MKKDVDLDNVDAGQLTSAVGKGNIVGTALSNSGIPLNISFSEPSTQHNLSEQIENRKFLAEICFEQLGVQSISFLKQSSIHLYSNMKYNGIVVDMGAQYTQISPVNEGYTSCLSAGFFKVTGQMCDEHLFRSLYEMYTPPSNANTSYPNMDILSLFKIKMDLKETIFSPYKVPFNYEVL